MLGDDFFLFLFFLGGGGTGEIEGRRREMGWEGRGGKGKK